ncbi:6063_t:CDS:2 [Racocetra fulgida]|uniref:6063_t:CDS:1 n=1 Tax=Racocetra fulgida TaxID=60492 RepID=A0A9N9F4R8_9GLOM|nr:6063_t:CDS:2 [Racocetra fulgida]
MQFHFIHDTLTFLSSPTLQHDHDSLFAQQVANPPYRLVLPLDILLAPSRRSLTHLPRPQNSFLLFRKDYNERIRLSNRNKSKKLSVKTISENAKLEWSQQPLIVKNFFKVLAKEADKHTTVVENVSTFDINGSIASDVDIIELEKYFDIQAYYNDKK